MLNIYYICDIEPRPYSAAVKIEIICFQISDIHISRYYDRARGPDLREFTSKSLNIIKPSVVLVTGMNMFGPNLVE